MPSLKEKQLNAITRNCKAIWIDKLQHRGCLLVLEVQLKSLWNMSKDAIFYYRSEKDKCTFKFPSTTVLRLPPQYDTYQQTRLTNSMIYYNKEISQTCTKWQIEYLPTSWRAMRKFVLCLVVMVPKT
eukprot:4386094-Amphidinium_carterae.1